MNILVTGASGFVGSQIVTDLLKLEHNITCCVRNVKYTKKLFPDANVIFCDFNQDIAIDDWLPRLKNIDIVINTVGIFYHPNKKIIWKIHFNAPKALFDACVKSHVKKIIHISGLGVDQYDVDYAKSKLAADQYLQKITIPAVILRPSLIYGRGSYGSTSLFRGLSALPFFIFVPGKGNQTFQPIYLPDLSLSIIKLIDEFTSHSIILNAVCREKIHLRTMLEIWRQWLGFSQPVILSVPLFLIRSLIIFGNLLPNSTINSASYKMLALSNTSSEQETLNFFNLIKFSPRNFESGVFSQPSTVQDRWHAQLYFVKPILKFSLAFLWIFTGIISIFLYPLSNSYWLLSKVGISHFWQPIFLYSASFLNLGIGLALLFNFHVRKICVLQCLVVLIYTFIITLKIPDFWLHPFGPITKNIPFLIGIYILYILENDR